MSIEHLEYARTYCARHGWELDEATFQVLDTPGNVWIAKVTTTHLTERGLREQSFYLLMSARQAVVIESYVLPVLGVYIQVQKESNQ